MRLRDVERNSDRLAPVCDWADRWLIQPFAGIDRLRGQIAAALALQRRWSRGKALLRDSLSNVHEESNVGDSGFLLCGTKR